MKVRGTVYIYASATRYDSIEEDRLGEDYEVSMDELVPGLVVGTIDIVGCELDEAGGYAWALARPNRLPVALKPQSHPNPVWFFPFTSA